MCFVRFSCENGRLKPVASCKLTTIRHLLGNNTVYTTTNKCFILHVLCFFWTHLANNFICFSRKTTKISCEVIHTSTDVTKGRPSSFRGTCPCSNDSTLSARVGHNVAHGIGCLWWDRRDALDVSRSRALHCVSWTKTWQIMLVCV